MRNVRAGVAGIVCLLVLLGCSSGGADGQGSPASGPSSSAGNSSASCVVPTSSPIPASSGGVQFAECDHAPGAADVSTMERGKEFDAAPNFFYFKLCGRPCWLPLYPTPEYKPGHAVTDGYPLESFQGQAGDKVHVVCQVRGDMLRNDNGPMSDWWDKILVPKEHLKTTAGLQPAPDGTGYYSYGNDGWLGNTGDHGIPCN